MEKLSRKFGVSRPKWKVEIYVRTHDSTVMTSSSTVDELYCAETVCSYGAPSTVLDNDGIWIVVGKEASKAQDWN